MAEGNGFDLTGEANRILGGLARKARPRPDDEEKVCEGCGENWGLTEWEFCPHCGGELISGEDQRERDEDREMDRRERERRLG